MANTLKSLGNGAVGFIDWLGRGWAVLALVVVHFVHPKELTLRFDEPLFGVGVGDHVGRGLVGDDVVE